MSGAWARLVAKASPEELEELNTALIEIQTETTQRLARKQKQFFGDVSSQGSDGNWYSMSDWLMEGPCG